MSPGSTPGPSAGSPADAPAPSAENPLRPPSAPVRTTSTPADRAVRAYAARREALLSVTEDHVRNVRELLDEAGINYLSVTGRTKEVSSFATKAARAVDGRPLFADPLRDITDQVGLRVITYLQSDVVAVADLLADQFDVIEDRDMGEETASEGRFGYASRHLLLTAKHVDGVSTASRPPAPLAQVQIRTVLQHAWAEFEHDIRYKGSIPAQHGPELDRRFALAAGLLELADREFTAIRERLRESATAPPSGRVGDGVRIDPQELAAFLDGRFGAAGWSRTDRYDWMCGLLTDLGITTLDELTGLLASVDDEAINSRMAYRYPAGAVRRLDDVLLAVFGTRYIALDGNAHRTRLLALRLEKVRPPAGPGTARPAATGRGG